MSAHTPGRLYTLPKHPDTFHAETPGGRGLRVGEASSRRTKAEDYANARRLVACWNACDGYDTEALESEDLMTLFQCRTISKLMDAKTQRDDLLAALSGLLSYFESGNRVPVDKATIKADSPEVIAARAAIQKVEGK